MGSKIINFKDLKVEHPNRYKVTDSNGTEDIKKIDFDPGLIYQQGTPESAENFNNIQKNCIYEVNGVRILEGQEEIYDISIDGFDNFEFESLKILMTPNATNTIKGSFVRLNGAKYIIKNRTDSIGIGQIFSGESIFISLHYARKTADVVATLNGGYVGTLKEGFDKKSDKSTQIIAGAGLTGGGDLSSDKTLNVVSEDAGIIINANSIKLNVLDSVASTDTIRPASPNAVRIAHENANGRVSKNGDTMSGTLTVPALEFKNSATPHVDFTRGSENIDFHHRIISHGSGVLQFLGIVDNNSFSFNGSVTATKFLGSLQGKADTATKLFTTRQINGTNFDGAADITTANWGTARNITIGNTAKPVNGSGNVGWSIAEIGAVNKAGDVLAGGLRTASIGDGFALTFKAGDGSPASNRTGIFGGNDAGGTLSKANNIDIKSWFGTSFSHADSEIPTISFDNRSGDAIFKGLIESSLGRSVGADRSLKFRIGSGIYPSGAVSTIVYFGSAFPVACHGVVCVEQHADPSWASNHLKVLSKATDSFTLACSSRFAITYVFVAWGE